MPCCGLVGGCGARAVYRKTPIYFIVVNGEQEFFSTVWGMITSNTYLFSKNSF